MTLNISCVSSAESVTIDPLNTSFMFYNTESLFLAFFDCSIYSVNLVKLLSYPLTKAKRKSSDLTFPDATSAFYKKVLKSECVLAQY